MSGPIVKDNLFVTLNQSNGWISQGELTAPIYNAKQVRVLANHNAIIKANFISDCYILDGNSEIAKKELGICFAGDDKTWFRVKDNVINNPIVELYSSVSFDSLSINFQFI